jgi:V/A-type H+-transporting ATPase subunit F
VFWAQPSAVVQRTTLPHSVARGKLLATLDQIYFIGEEDQLLGFRAIGVTVVGVTGLGDAERAVRKAARDGAVAIFLTESWGEHLAETLRDYEDAALPVITLIPTLSGSSGKAFERIRRMVERALGTTIDM